jgi:hypothetical protein
MPPVDPAEPISRYIFSSSHFSAQNNRVKHNAFMPSSGETSVFRTRGLAEAGIWAIGEDLSTQRNQQLHARGDLLTSDVLSLSLAVEPSEPPPRHANITGWPHEKDLIKLRAMELAGKATLRLPALAGGTP